MEALAAGDLVSPIEFTGYKDCVGRITRAMHVFQNTATKVDGVLANISGDVAQVHELLATMAADNQAQSAAITQISAAIGMMDQSTQQNAAMVEQTSAAARNLAGEVEQLADQAIQFIVTEVDATYRQPPRVVRPIVVETFAYASPVKPLPVRAIPILVRIDNEWNGF